MKSHRRSRPQARDRARRHRGPRRGERRVGARGPRLLAVGQQRGREDRRHAGRLPRRQRRARRRGSTRPAKVGDTPADFPGASRAPGVGLNAATKVGDTPADFPGASRAPDVAPPTIQVVRPERTVVRDVNEVLPIALSGAALLIVLMGAAFVLVRVLVERRHAVGRSH